MLIRSGFFFPAALVCNWLFTLLVCGFEPVLSSFLSPIWALPGDGGGGGDGVYGRFLSDVREQAAVADGVAVCHSRNQVGSPARGEGVRAGEEQRGSGGISGNRLVEVGAAVGGQAQVLGSSSGPRMVRALPTKVVETTTHLNNKV